SAQAEFVAQMNVFRVRAMAILQGAARLEALITGEVDGRVVFETSPLANVQAQVTGLVDAGVSGDIEIAPGRIACVIPAFEAAGQTLVKVGTDAQATLSGWAEFVSAIKGGLSSEGATPWGSFR